MKKSVEKGILESNHISPLLRDRDGEVRGNGRGGVQGGMKGELGGEADGRAGAGQGHSMAG